VLGEASLEPPEVVEMLACPEQDEPGGKRLLVAASSSVSHAGEQAGFASDVALLWCG
jgi:hypothetical protein